MYSTHGPTIGAPAVAPHGESVPVRAFITRAAEKLFTWLTLARTRRELAALDERALHDIGVDRATASEEIRKPFWIM
jgi:uncharacterized protein YjiS (DUF1127 family)